MSGKNDPKTLSQALKDLEQESRESLSEQLDALKNVIAKLEPKISAVAKSAVSESSEHMKKAKDQITKKVEKHPFWAIGIIALIVVAVGWFLSQRSGDQDAE